MGSVSCVPIVFLFMMYLPTPGESESSTLTFRSGIFRLLLNEVRRCFLILNWSEWSDDRYEPGIFSFDGKYACPGVFLSVFVKIHARSAFGIEYFVLSM